MLAIEFSLNFITYLRKVNRTQPNPKVIGTFITVSLVLIVGMIMYFGSTNLLNRSTHFILFFDQSVNGLSIGSPVKFRGVPVGTVKSILIRAEGQREDSNAIPVLIEINRSRLEDDLGVSNTAFDPDRIMEQIDRGLVAELNLESLITGQLFVDFSFSPRAREHQMPHLETFNGIVEVPTLNSSLDEITADIAHIIADFRSLDLEEINRNVNAVLSSAALVLQGIDSEGMSASVSEAADEVTALVRSPEFRDTLFSAHGAFEEIRDTAESFNLSDGPLAEVVDTWTEQITETLDSLEAFTQQANALLLPDSTARYEFENMLRELARAARSLRLLTDYLERNPNALITGRPKETE